MKIEVNTDHNVDGSEELTSRVVADVTVTLLRFDDQLTRVQVHLGDENADKGGGADKRCTIEAWPAGSQPVAATDHGATVDEACSGALRKLSSALDSRLGKMGKRKGGDTLRRTEQN